MEPPFPVCPTCGERFESAGNYRPKDDDTDVIAYFHGESTCEDVWARLAGNHGDPLERLGSLHDYDDAKVVDLVEQSDFVFDLTRRTP